MAATVAGPLPSSARTSSERNGRESMNSSSSASAAGNRSAPFQIGSTIDRNISLEREPLGDDDATVRIRLGFELAAGTLMQRPRHLRNRPAEKPAIYRGNQRRGWPSKKRRRISDPLIS